MHITLIKSLTKPQDASLLAIATLGQHIVYLNTKQASQIVLDQHKKLFLFGDIYYFIQSQKTQLLDASQETAIKKIFNEYPLEKVVEQLEGEYFGIIVDAKRKEVKLFADRFARLDGFYGQENGNLVFSNELESVFQWVKPIYDQKMLAHLFSVFGWYAPKGLTIYNNVQRLTVGEILTVTDKNLASQRVAFKPQHIEDNGTDDLKEYEKALRNSIVARVPKTQEKIWVSSSSGWDSSVILGLLVDMYGAKRINMMTGSMQYSKETGRINQFELNKIKKIGAFYGIKPHTVPLDFKNKSAVTYWQRLAPRLKSKHMYSFSGFNFGRISDGIAKADKPGRIVFNGETSDSFHNFGFSQFCTFFHSVKSFTEYGDKMNCYLYGPTFLKKVLEGNHENDKVYQIFRHMMPGVSFYAPGEDRATTLERYLLPLFYGSPRLPFAVTINNPALKQSASRDMKHFAFREFMPEVVASMNEKNMYSWIIYMYQHMHSQGSTVAIHRNAMALNNHHCRSPFNDYQMMDVLSRAPESWGRGLDFNHTKHPLKWLAKNRIKFPYALLQEGAHSYLYDVLEGFSLMAEISYRSAFTSHFREVLLQRRYREILDESYFDVGYLDRLADDFIKGKEAKGQDFTNTLSLITLCSTGWY